MKRRALKLHKKGNFRTIQKKRVFSQVLEDIKKRRKNWNKIEKERLWEEIKGFSSIDPYKAETILKDESSDREEVTER
jgi:hypothetical protein